jgi:hypothetical protein
MNEEEQRRVVEGLMLIDLRHFPEESKQHLGKCHTMAFCATIP